MEFERKYVPGVTWVSMDMDIGVKVTLKEGYFGCWKKVRAFY